VDPYPDRVQILWWLVPPIVATVLAMLWVSWLGREGRGEVDPEVAARRLGRAMSRPSRVAPRGTPARSTSRGERSSGIAVRSSSRPAASSGRGRESGKAADTDSARQAS
jgi:hypothetical protein